MASAENTNRQRLPAALVMVYVCIVLAFCAARVYPAFRRRHQIDRDIRKTALELEEQKLLLPAYATLLPLTASRPKEGRSPFLGRLPYTEIPSSQTQLRQLGETAGLRTLAIAPRAESLVSGAKHIEMEWRLEGDIKDLQGVLAGLADLDYVEHVGRVRIQQSEHDIQYHLSIWLALQ
jgi:hypothetical protein